MPRVVTRSLVENGTPWSVPSLAPFRPRARSAARASFNAWSAVRVTKAFRRGLRRSMRSRTARITSTGESFRLLKRPTISDAGIQQRSSAVIGDLLAGRDGVGRPAAVGSARADAPWKRRTRERARALRIGYYAKAPGATTDGERWAVSARGADGSGAGRGRASRPRCRAR